MSVNATDLHQTMASCHPNNWVITNPDIQETILRALSLLAAVEDGDEIVQRLNQTIEPGKPGFIRSNLERREAAARIVSDAQEIAALKGEVEQARKTQGYWKDEHNAANAEIAALAVERDAYKDAAERRMEERDALKDELASVKAHAEAMKSLFLLQLKNQAAATWEWKAETEAVIRAYKERPRHLTAAHKEGA